MPQIRHLLTHINIIGHSIIIVDASLKLLFSFFSIFVFDFDLCVTALFKKLRISFQVCLLISAVTAIANEKPKKPTPTSQDQNDDLDASMGEITDGNEENQDAPTALPGVAFWIVFQAPDCVLSHIERKYMKMFASCGFSIYSCKVCL